MEIKGNAIAYAEEAELSIIRSELDNQALETLQSHSKITDIAPLGYLAINIGGEAEASARNNGYSRSSNGSTSRSRARNEG